MHDSSPKTIIPQIGQEQLATVYNIEVEDEHVYYANGFLVHNCTVCGPLHRKLFPIDRIPFGGPPGHPRCRCFISGSVATTEAEGQANDKEATANHKEWVKQQAEQEKARAARRKKGA
ncbi:MAG: hypothetical protein ACYCX4_02615 [Bacillota bacterium]